MSEVIEYAAANGIATLTFNRPQVLNALDIDMLRAFPTAVARARDDSAARVLVLRGAGKAFIAGGDIGMFKTVLHEVHRLTDEVGGALHEGIAMLREMAKPVIASVHGATAGAGLSIMLAADIVIAAEGTRFTTAYTKIGASPDGGATWFLPRLVGYHKAMEMLLLADADDAAAMHALGIVNRVVPADALDAETLTLAQRLASGPANAYAEIKRLVNNQQKQSLTDHLADEARAFARASAHANFAEGVTAFTEKRKPRFAPK
jgi:2-(1,2-epoxy-1,2-dihydrophenyl)acetyl-CoA isomerase